MRSSIALLVLLSVLTLVASSVAQDSALTCSKFRILLKDGSHISGVNGTLSGDTFSGTRKDGTTLTLQTGDIRSLDRRVGTQAGKGALIGAAVGVMSVVSALVQIGSDENSELNDDAVVPVFAGFTIGGALIGMAVGSASDRWEHVNLPKLTGMIDRHGAHLSFCLNF